MPAGQRGGHSDENVDFKKKKFGFRLCAAETESIFDGCHDILMASKLFQDLTGFELQLKSFIYFCRQGLGCCLQFGANTIHNKNFFNGVVQNLSKLCFSSNWDQTSFSLLGNKIKYYQTIIINKPNLLKDKHGKSLTD